MHKKIQRYNQKQSKLLPKEDTIIVAGRETTLAQEIHIRADISSAKFILQKLKDKRAVGYTRASAAEVIKVIDM